MQLDKLQLDLRPRANAQALDLGFALLRANAADAYRAWLALWLPACAVAAALTLLLPAYASWWPLLPWVLRPLFERAPLYLLSRRVFGDAVTWRQALRAWPRQLGGGWLRMLTWWRVCVPGRGLYQPVWLLENARGKVAAGRRKIISLGGSGRAAFWFGVACVHFELVLEFGLLGFIGIFFSDSAAANPFALFVNKMQHPDSLWLPLAMLGCYAAAVGVIGPIYTACTFTLYLNRRATLEAWDLEIVLRQIRAPAPKGARAGVARAAPAYLLAALLLPGLLLAGHVSPARADAAPAAAPAAAAAGASRAAPAARASTPAANGTSEADCTAPLQRLGQDTVRGPDHGARQAAVRDEVRRLFAHPDLRGYVCADGWRLKHRPAEEKTTPQHPDDDPKAWLTAVATALQVLLIALALGLAGWLLYRYRDKLPSLAATRRHVPATEVGGLDIRTESLPDDVAATVRQLWASGQRRAALALLYRATLSRLVTQDGLQIDSGATEGDCLRYARLAAQRQQLSAARLAVAGAATTLWLNGAYGDRWPDTAAVEALCRDWQHQFAAAPEHLS